MNCENQEPPSIVQLRLRAQSEFNKHRKLFIQNVPPVTHQDVRYYLGDIVPADIVISKRLHHVIITLKCSDDVDKALAVLGGRTLAGSPVELELYPRRMMLCICGLPLHFNQGKYVEFLSKYGKVETAFLSYTQRGDCKGYGFVEFAHNRATLEDVQKKLNGTSLEGNVLYCSLVSESIRVFEDTFTTSLFCIYNPRRTSVDPKLLRILDAAHKCQMAEDKLLYILECPSVEVAEQLWYYSRQAPSSSSLTIHFAMPSISAADIVNIIINTKRQYPTIDNETEIRYLLIELFPSDPRLVMSIEGLLKQMDAQLQGQQLTINVIMNLVNLLKTSRPSNTLSSTLLDVTVPPPAHIPSDNHSLESGNLNGSQTTLLNSNPVNLANGPVTRSRTAMVQGAFQTRLSQDRLMNAELENRFPFPNSAQRNGDIWSRSGILSGLQPHSQPVNRSNSRPGSQLGSRPGSRLGNQLNSQRDIELHSPPQVNTHHDHRILEDDHADLESSSGPITRQRRHALEKVVTPYIKTPGMKSKKKDRPVLFEVDLNKALEELFTYKQDNTKTATPSIVKKLLPDPEASPGTPRYIGQHSQGIGGHYADSYVPSLRRAIL